jgi:hypothetical protein
VPKFCVLDAVVPSSDGRRDVLENETESHQLVRTFQQIMLDALANFRPEAVRNRADHQKCDHENDDQTSHSTRI